MSKEVSKSNKISAFIVAYHEESVIERCLTSLKDVVDEIIVIHDGKCNDKTLEISRKYTDQVYEMPVNKGIGESHYIFALKKCKNPWVLRIDADEFLSEELAKDLYFLVRDTSVSAYYFVWPVWDGSEYISKNWPYKIFLFQKKKIGFVDIFHFPIIVYGKSKKVQLVVEHKPAYNNYDKQTFINKTLKWCKYQAQDYTKNILEKDRFNIKDLSQIEKSISSKKRFFKFPLVCYLVSLIFGLSDILKYPKLFLFFQKGFWLTVFLSAKYTYTVAKEYNYLMAKKLIK